MALWRAIIAAAAAQAGAAAARAPLAQVEGRAPWPAGKLAMVHNAVQLHAALQGTAAHIHIVDHIQDEAPAGAHAHAPCSAPSGNLGAGHRDGGDGSRDASCADAGSDGEHALGAAPRGSSARTAALTAPRRSLEQTRLRSITVRACAMLHCCEHVFVPYMSVHVLRMQRCERKRDHRSALRSVNAELIMPIFRPVTRIRLSLRATTVQSWRTMRTLTRQCWPAALRPGML